METRKFMSSSKEDSNVCFLKKQSYKESGIDCTSKRAL